MTTPARADEQGKPASARSMRASTRTPGQIAALYRTVAVEMADGTYGLERPPAERKHRGRLDGGTKR